jgi:peptidoglycan/LPS O-acetylase OafA/YrhL
MVTMVLLTPVTRLLLGNYYTSKGLDASVVADSIYWNTLSHLDAFFMGGLIPVLSLDNKIRKPARILAGSFVLVFVAGLLNYLNSSSGAFYFNDLGYNHGLNNYEHVWHYTCLNIFFASLLLTLVSVHSQQILKGLRRFLEHQWMVRIGRVSYGMYVYHWGVLAYFYNKIFTAEALWMKVVLFIPYVILVYIISELSFRFFESRFIKLKDQLFSDKPKKEPTRAIIEQTLISK